MADNGCGRHGAWLIRAGLLLIAAAALLTGWNLQQQKEGAQASKTTLTTLLPRIEERRGGTIDGGVQNSDTEAVHAADEFPDYVLNPAMDMPAVEIEGDRYIGVLSIPALNVELPVMEGWDYPSLRKAPCRYTGSVYQDNMIVCAHNYDSHFGGIKNLSIGDRVFFTDTDGNRFTYQVSELEILDPFARDEMRSGNWDLTLFTCTLGGATRVTVRCQRV